MPVWLGAGRLTRYKAASWRVEHPMSPLATEGALEGQNFTSHPLQGPTDLVLLLQGVHAGATSVGSGAECGTWYRGHDRL
jgi:hypothetical protein